jgi:hypothetical protein
MFCPKCGTEYREGFNTCADCDVPLVAEPPVESRLEEIKQSVSGRSFVEVFRHDQPFVAQMALDELEEEGVVGFMQEGAVTGLEQSPVCPAPAPGVEYVIYVHETKLPEAKSIIESLPIDRDLLSVSWRKTTNPKRQRKLMIYWAVVLVPFLFTLLFMLRTCVSDMSQ